MSKKDEENYQEAEKQEKASRKLTGPAKVEEKPQSMAFIEGMLNSSNEDLRRS